MTADPSSSGAGPGQPQPTQGQPGAGPKSVDDRLDAQDEKIAGIGETVGKIWDKISGGTPKESTAPPAQGEPEPGLSVAEQVRRGVEEIRAKDKQDADDAAAADADQSWRKSVDDRLAERKPAEPATGARTKLQRALFGKPDQR